MSDRGRWKDTVPDEDRGRGLELIAALLEAPAIERTPEGTTISFRAPLPREPGR